MLTYEYKCLDCKRNFDIAQRITESPKRKCPKCGGRIRRLIGGGAGIIFKGSGFYATDYRSDAYKKKAAAETPKPAETPTPAEPSKETKEKKP